MSKSGECINGNADELLEMLKMSPNIDSFEDRDSLTLLRTGGQAPSMVAKVSSRLILSARPSGECLLVDVDSGRNTEFDAIAILRMAVVIREYALVIEALESADE